MKSQHKYTTVALAALLVFSPCLNSCMSDANLTRAEGTAIGIAGAGGAAFGLSKAFGASNGTAATIGGIAALFGGVAGYAWGDHVAEEKRMAANEEDRLRANIRQLDARIGEARKFNDDLTRQLNSKKRISSADMKGIKSSCSQNTKIINADISIAQKALKGTSGAKAAELRSKIASLKSQRDAMARNVSALKAYEVKA